MNERHKRFVFELLKDPDITQEQAAINAGYAANSARITASKLLTNPNIRDAVDQGRTKMAAKQQVTLDQLVEEMKEFAFAKIPDIIEWNDSGVGFRPADKIKALESIGKWLGLIVDKSEVTVFEDNPAITVESRVLKRIVNEASDE